jgi:hypothetical protein
MRTPDLSPSLTKAEVALCDPPGTLPEERTPRHWPPRKVIQFRKARAALAPRVPEVTHLTLYSLFPREWYEIQKVFPDEAPGLLKLPRFHGFPVLGSITIRNADEANRWTAFFRDQIISTSRSFCGFAPRHGFRFHTGRGHVDIVMCFNCDELQIHDGGEQPDREINPSFSPAVESVLTRLFDKRSIKREKTSSEISAWLEKNKMGSVAITPDSIDF